MSAFTPITQEEAEANYFAMHILVPDTALRAAIEKIGPVDLFADVSLVTKLAKQFQTSENVITFRLRELRTP